MSWFRKKMWLDVEGGWAGWIDTPLSGADAGSEGWGAQGVLLNGGGYSLNSWGTHKRYTFEWSGASSRESAQFMQSLRQGAYGKGLIHFIEPTIYDTNILPARVASPALSITDGGRPLVTTGAFGPYEIEANATSSTMAPWTSARWVFASPQSGYRGDADSIRISVPDGYSLAVGAIYTTSGHGRFHSGVYVRHGGTDTLIPKSGADDPFIIHQESTFSGQWLARLWIGKTTTAHATVTVTAIVARLIPTNKRFSSLGPGYGYGDQPYGEGPYGGVRRTAAFDNIRRGPWVGGMGNSGVRFNGTPTMVHNTGVDGGQVGYAASFIETGAWGR